MPTSQRQVVVYTDGRPGQAFLVRNALADAGIEAFVVNDALQAAAGDLPLGWSIAPRVVVAAADETAAREILRQFRDTSGSATPHGDVELAADDGRHSAADAVREVYTPPLCPRCDKPRITMCPICQTSGVNFPLGYHPSTDDEEGDAPLLLCPTCDEAFRPVYLRRCEWCGHDFGAGIEPKSQEVTQFLNDRVITATVGMAIAILAILAYFAALVR